jgi:3-oxoacyl-[acyl-carrier-protein] synthase-3
LETAFKRKNKLSAYISDIGIFLPEKIVSSCELEAIINKNGKLLPSGSIERLFGVKERRYADNDMQASDLGVQAAISVVEKHGAASIDCMIFASASSDLAEPATANIAHAKLGLHCPAFDIKNACNSFVTALQIASSFIDANTYKKVLIISGEKTSTSIRFQPKNGEDLKKRLASLSFGDAGSAVMVEQSVNGCGIFFQKFKTVGKHWELCTIKGGGTMFPTDFDKSFFEGETAKLANVFIKEGGSFLQACFAEAGLSLSEIDHVFTHQVSSKSFDVIAAASCFPNHKIIKICDLYGNTASASIPISLYTAEKKGLLKHGDRIAIIGLAAGISISIQLMIWK